jgi:FkbM family methyltransferase
MGKVVKYKGRCYEISDLGVIYRDREVRWEDGAEDYTYKLEWENLGLGETIGLEYRLNKDSVVMEVGGYKGEWTERVSSLYGSRVIVFEPIKEYFDILTERFKEKKEIEILCAGLGTVDIETRIGRNGDGSSCFKKDLPQEKIKVIDVVRWLKDRGIRSVDLIQLNCEGSEYGILRRLIMNGLIRTFKNIKVQFHKVNEQSDLEREEVRGLLKETHKESWCYPWVWESWEVYDPA